MKNFLLLILFLFMMTVSSGQSMANDYVLTLGFGPSFMRASEISIQAKGDSGLLDMRVYRNYKTRETSIENKAAFPASKLIKLTTFLKNYKFQIKSSIDTVGSHKVFVHGDSVLVYDINMGSDGINVHGDFNQNNITHKFAFWSPEKGTENADLMVVLFDLLDKVFTEQRMINYVEQLEQYFPHQLGLKKLSDEPLTYKLFGSITSNEKDELYNFLQSMPLNRKIIIDMSNYSRMGSMFFDEFNQYCASNRNIYWLNPTYQGLIDLYKIGIPNQQIISKKKIIKITEKDGSEVITSGKN